MKLFESVKSKLARIGYNANQRAFNTEQLIFLLKKALVNTLVGVYLFHVANTPKEFLESIFMFTVGILALIANLSTIYKTATIFKFIEYGEELVNERE